MMAGAFLFLGCHGLLAWAEQRVTSGEAALFMTAIPLWLIGLESLLARTRRPAECWPGWAWASAGSRCSPGRGLVRAA